MKKEVKTTKNKVSIKQRLRTVYKLAGHVALFVLATHGLRQLFSVMQEQLSVVLTVGIMLCLLRIIFDE